MEKIISARVDESVAQTIEFLARVMKTSKKKVIEQAINEFAKKQGGQKTDMLERTHGVWKRRASAETIASEVRKKFQNSMIRHQR